VVAAWVTLRAAGGLLGQSFDLTGAGPYVVGRGGDCDVRIPEECDLVSTRHCQLDLEPSAPLVHVCDLDSTNGTYLDGQSIAGGPRVVKDGARLVLGANQRPSGDVEYQVAFDVEIVPYEFVSRLEGGQLADVFLVRDGQGRPLVLKRLPIEAAGHAVAWRHFQREVENMRKLDHPHLVGLRDGGVLGSRPFLMSEYCPGGSLDAHVARLATQHQSLSLEDALTVTCQLLAALAYLHDDASVHALFAEGGEDTQGMVHRDVHPGNVLLAATGSPWIVKLGDYGLAKAFRTAGQSGLTVTGAWGGTPKFMPKRQLVDYLGTQTSCDVWAATACLYWMLTGTTPRDFDPYLHPAQVVRDTNVVKIRSRPAGERIPADLGALIDLTLKAEGDPDNTPSAAHLKAEFEHTLG
jgi:serine/threonine protein kinase